MYASKLNKTRSEDRNTIKSTDQEKDTGTDEVPYTKLDTNVVGSTQVINLDIGTKTLAPKRMRQRTIPT